MEAPLWKLDKLEASGQQQVNRASETFAFAGFRWPKDNPTCIRFVSEHPEVFLTLDPVYFIEEEVAVARTDSSTAAKRVFEIFENARLLFIDEPQTLAFAVKRGFLKVPAPFCVRLKDRLVEQDAFYSEFGFAVIKKTLMHFGEAVMDEYRTTDEATINTKAVRKAWDSVKKFVSLVAPNHTSLYDPEVRRYGAPMRASSSLTTNAPAATPASSHTSTKIDSNKQSGTSKPPSAVDTSSLIVTMNDRGHAALATKRNAKNSPTSSAKPEKRVRQDSGSHTTEIASQSKRIKDSFWIGHNIRFEALGKAVEIQEPKKRTEAMEGSAKANEAKLQKYADLKKRMRFMVQSSKEGREKEAELKKENHGLQKRIEAMEASSKASEANEAKLQKELLLKVIEAAGLEADNQRIKETGSFKQRLELARQTLEIEQKTARIKDLEETEGVLRKRIEELEALQKEADQAKDLERATGVLRKCNEGLKTFQSKADAAKDTEENAKLLRKNIEGLKALQVKTAGIKDAREADGLLREGIKDLELFLKIRDLEPGF